MSREKLEIRKGGKLIETRWVYDETTEEGSHIEYDRTNVAIRSLFEACELASDVTLKDIFLLLNTELELFNLVLGNWCKEIVTEGLTQPEKLYDLSIYDPEQIEYLELKYTPEYDTYEGVSSIEGLHRLDFSATGVVLQNDYDHHLAGERIPWGVSFTPSNELINIPIRLSDKFVITEGIFSMVGGLPQTLGNYSNPGYTLGAILNGIIWELSFHGEPTTRDDFSKSVRDTAKAAKEQLENGNI